MLHVIGAAGNKRGRAELAHIFCREGSDLAEDLAAQIPAYGHGGAAAAPHCADGGNHLNKGHDEHDSAGAPDIVDIALRHAFINDLGVQGGQIQGRRGGQRLQDKYRYDVERIRRRAGEEDSD